MNYLAYMTLLDSCAESAEHSQHIYEFHDLVKLMIEQLVPPIVEQEIEKYLSEKLDERIRTLVQEDLQKRKDKQTVNVEAYFNGKPATDANIIKGVRDMVANALKKIGKGR